MPKGCKVKPSPHTTTTTTTYPRPMRSHKEDQRTYTYRTNKRTVPSFALSLSLMYRPGGAYALQGAWEDDVQQGHGEARYPDGSVYVGAWRAGAWHGKGMLRGADGGSYEGEFRGGARHGNGGSHQGLHGCMDAKDRTDA